MIESARVLAIIPARSGSKGLPGKNIRPLLGKPLLGWPITAAKASCYVDKVVVSTDSDAYAKIARFHGAETPVLRPAKFSSDTSPSSDAVIHMLDELLKQGEAYDYLVLLEPTSPLTEAADIDRALLLLYSRREDADSIVSVTELNSAHPAFTVQNMPDGRIRPYGGLDFSQLPRRQDLDPLFVLDGSLYISSVDAYRLKLSFCHSRTLSYVMPAYKAYEVDSLEDFICIEALLARRDELGVQS
jgi:N-acylneuraminate cytidylyltransferase/CMP-N,N'-diacetyllegionaminic acid synthase